MDVLQAAYRVAHDFKPDGAVGLARKQGISSGTFSNEVNPEQETHKLGLGRAVAMSLAAQDFRILHAFADTCGFVAIAKPDLASVTDERLLDLFLIRDQASGEFARAVTRALEDRRISEDELSAIEDRAYTYVATVLEIVERLRSYRRG